MPCQNVDSHAGLPSHADSILLGPGDLGLGKSLLWGDHPVKGCVLRRGLEMESRLCGVRKFGQ